MRRIKLRRNAPPAEQKCRRLLMLKNTAPLRGALERGICVIACCVVTLQECDDRMTDTAAIYAEPQSYEALVEALKHRAGEIEISYSDLDAIAGLAAGYAGKVFGPSKVKRLGPLCLFMVLPALGLKLTLAADPDALRRYVHRRKRRNGRQARPQNLAQRCGPRTLERALRHLAEFSWNDVLAMVSGARREHAAQREAKAAAEQAAREAAKTNSSKHRRNGKADAEHAAVAR
jgi:hypothetical protein